MGVGMDEGLQKVFRVLVFVARKEGREEGKERERGKMDVRREVSVGPFVEREESCGMVGKRRGGEKGVEEGRSEVGDVWS